MRFDGTRVVVTGGARGIGRGIVDAFLHEGAHVVATDVPGDDLATLQATASGARPPVGPRRRPGRRRPGRGIVPAAVGPLGGVDVLVNNAGVQPDGPVLDLTPTDIDACLAVNVRAPMLLMRDACSHLIDRGAPGAIVNIASANAFHNESPESIYNASKAALVALTKAVAHEVGHLGIRANSVAPGETITPEADRGAGGRSSRERRRAALPVEDPAGARGHAQRPGDGGALPRKRRRALHLRPDARRRRRGDRGRQVVRRRPCPATAVAGAPITGQALGYASPRARRIASVTSWVVQRHLEEADLLLVHGAVGLLLDLVFEHMHHGEPQLDSRQWTHPRRIAVSHGLGGHLDRLRVAGAEHHDDVIGADVPRRSA